METVSSPRKLKSPLQDVIINAKTSVTCSNVPECLFDATASKKHFSKFGKVQKIRLFPKRHICIIDYDTPASAERAVLNAGAYDGFMFDVTRSKARMRKRSTRKEDDPDWVPDSDVEDELSAMGGTPTYRVTRQKPMDLESEPVRETKIKAPVRAIKSMPLKKVLPIREKKSIVTQPVGIIEPPVAVVNTQTTLNTSAAAAELHQLRSKISLTPDEQWRILDARDRILRAWGGAGSRIKVGGATIGTCPDMCPEKELLHRQAEHQVMTLETVIDSDGELEPWRAVKQYSRSSADQEIPMCFELRPAPVLMRTCAYLLHEIADTKRQVSLADWFHFMWDRLRSIRKDITQQALCCSESICLVEMCARFHAHCAARLADLEHTQFDQKLNTDNLTKCLQTLKHMYGDVSPEEKPKEAEFRGYVALLNLGDANFWWEIKQLPVQIQKSAPIVFAIKVFNAIDNNNYVQFFRLVKNEATYLQACILLRYFNDVRARALARIVKAYAPRGGSRYPAQDLMQSLAFESLESLKSFINHYGLRFARTDDGECEVTVILDRNQYIEDSDPYPTSRAVNLIESKRNCTVGEIIAGGALPELGYRNHVMYSSFNPDGRLKESALTAEDLGYNTHNDSSKDIKALKAEIKRISQSGKLTFTENKTNVFVKPDIVASKSSGNFSAPGVAVFSKPLNDGKLFSFKPAIPVASNDVIKNSPEKIFTEDTKNKFLFSKPQETIASTGGEPTNNVSKVFNDKQSNVFTLKEPSVFAPKEPNVFAMPGSSLFKSSEANVFASQESNLFTGKEKVKSLFEKTSVPKTNNVFGKSDVDQKQPNSLFGNTKSNDTATESNLFTGKEKVKRLFESSSVPESKNIFGKVNSDQSQPPKSIFGGGKSNDTLFKAPEPNSVFAQPFEPKPSSNLFTNTTSKNIFAVKEETKVDNPPSTSKNIFASAKTDLFKKPDVVQNTFEKGSNIFAKPASAGSSETNPPSNIFGTFSKPAESSNLFSKAEISDKQPNSIFLNGDAHATTSKLSPGSLFKSVVNTNGPDTIYSIYQSKNKAQSVADSILNSVATSQTPSVYEFNENEDEKIKQAEQQRLQEERIIAEKKLQEELKRKEEMRKQELLRLAEERRKEEERKKHELKLLEEKRRKEEQRKQEELRKRLEKEKEAELKRKAEEEKKFMEKVETESSELVETLLNEISNTILNNVLKEELEKHNSLMQFANTVADEILDNLCTEICVSELKAESFLTHKIMQKWFMVWKKHYARNIKRRQLLENTPVWLTQKTPQQEASYLRRFVENATLKNMNAFHKGYKFTGELKQLPIPEPFNIMEIIKTPLLKRMKQIHYPYDKCFFWKITLVSPGEMKWIHRKINIEKWILDAFSDKKQHEVSDTLINVGKQSWNHLMDFAISVSLLSKDRSNASHEAVEGSNALLFYATEHDENLAQIIQDTLNHKYPYQVVPVAVMIPSNMDRVKISVESLLSFLLKKNVITAFRIFVLDSRNIFESLNTSSKKAMKWLAKKFPPTPPLELDYLKSICQRYLGNEIWCRLKTEKDSRMDAVLSDLYKLIQCYNTAVDNLSNVITDEELFNYPSFPLEFQPYLDSSSPYPKPFEFIPSCVKTSDNVEAIKRIMNQLKLPDPKSEFNPINAISMQQQISSYCNQIGWLENSEEVVCKVLSVLPNELSNVSMPCKDFTRNFAHYNLIDLMNIIVYEKINRLKNFENRLAIYDKPALDNYRSALWLHQVSAINNMKHKALEYEDDVDFYIEAKRQKLELDSQEYLMLEDNDRTMVDENVKEKDKSISEYNNCIDAVKQLEHQLDEEKLKSLQLENLLRSALGEFN